MYLFKFSFVPHSAPFPTIIVLTYFMWCINQWHPDVSGSQLHPAGSHGLADGPAFKYIATPVLQGTPNPGLLLKLKEMFFQILWVEANLLPFVTQKRQFIFQISTGCWGHRGGRDCFEPSVVRVCYGLWTDESTGQVLYSCPLLIAPSALQLGQYRGLHQTIDFTPAVGHL